MNPNSVYEKLVGVGTDWADKEQAANLLEGTLKSVKAKIAIQHKDCGMSVAESELRAECDLIQRSKGASHTSTNRSN
jgi:hypothetical protein